MIFGEIKGFGADRSWHHTGLVLCAMICLFCLFWFLSEPESAPHRELKSAGLYWDVERMISFTGELAGFAGGAWCASKYQEMEARVGAIVFLALPLIYVLAAAARSVGIW